MNFYEMIYRRQQRETARMRRLSRLTRSIGQLTREIQILLAILAGLIVAVAVLALCS